MASADAFRTAASLTTDPQDIRKTANDAAYDGLAEAADACFRRAADMAQFSEDARAVGNDADYRGLKEAADYAWRRAASLPPAPPPPPKPKKPSLWSRICAFFSSMFGK